MKPQVHTASTNSTSNSGISKQSKAPWNLARISEHKLDLSLPYVYPQSSG